MEPPPRPDPTRARSPLGALRDLPGPAALPVLAGDAHASAAGGPDELPRDTHGCPTCGTLVELGLACPGCGRQARPVDLEKVMELLRSSVKNVYVLQVFSFFCGITAVAGLLIAYADRGRARGSWLESHSEWQVDTFWGVFWMGLAVLAGSWLAERFVGAGELVSLVGSVPALGWYIHRIVKGWMRLQDGDPVTEY